MSCSGWVMDVQSIWCLGGVTQSAVTPFQTLMIQSIQQRMICSHLTKGWWSCVKVLFVWTYIPPWGAWSYWDDCELFCECIKTLTFTLVSMLHINAISSSSLLLLVDCLSFASLGSVLFIHVPRDCLEPFPVKLCKRELSSQSTSQCFPGRG